MSTLRVNNLQIGQSGTAAQNFTLYQPTTPDGTLRLAVGNSGATTGDVLSVSNTGLSVTGTLSATGNVTLSGGTANGILYLNGSKVATTGSALTFDGSKLTVKGGNAGQFVLDNANEQYVQALFQRNATANTGADLLLDGSGNTFNFRNLAANMPFVWHLSASAGAPTEQMRLTSTGLGIGTSSPAQKLDVIGNAQIGNASTSAAVTRMYNQNSNLYVGVDSSTGGNTGTAYAQYFLGIGAYPMTFWTNTTERMRITSAGDVGIGTSSPQSKLHIDVDGTALRISRGSSIGFLYNTGTASTDITRLQSNGGSVQLYTSGGTATLDSSGNLGLGVTPSAATFKTLQIGNSNNVGSLSQDPSYNDFAFGSNCYLDTTWKYRKTGEGAALFRAYGYDGQFFWQRAGSGTAGNTISWTTAMMLDASGNLLVGTTTFRGRLTVESNSITTAVPFDSNDTRADASSSASFVFRRQGTSVGSITTTTTATSYNTSSDYRLKDNPQPLTGSGAFIDALKPKIWNWKADGSRGVGFIAHEVQEVSPGSVVGEKDGEQMQAMEYGSAEFIANIIAELQSLRQRVALLEGTQP